MHTRTNERLARLFRGEVEEVRVTEIRVDDLIVIPVKFSTEAEAKRVIGLNQVGRNTEVWYDEGSWSGFISRATRSGRVLRVVSEE